MADSCEVLSFAAHVVRGRWFFLFASFLIMAGAGATYLFGVYSKEIKFSLGYSQTTLNLLGFYKDLGANVGILVGLLHEITPTWFVLLVGSAINFIGYFMIWLAVNGKISKPKVWQMCMYIYMGATSQNFGNTGALVSTIKNFPESRGIVIGLLKGFTGLSGAILTQIYLATHGSDSKSLILLIAWLPSALSIVFVCTIREIKGARMPNEMKVFYHFLYVSIFLAMFLMFATILEKMVHFSKEAYAATATAVCALLFVPLFITIREELTVWKNKNKPIITTSISTKSPYFQTKQDLEMDNEMMSNQERGGERGGGENDQESWYKNILVKPKRGDDYTILQALLSLDMFALFLATFCGLGSCLTAIDNLGQIGESLGYPTKTVKSFVSLLSVWNFFGRIFSGFVSENLLNKYKFPRPLMMTLVLMLSCLGLLLIAFPFPGSIYIASVIIGFSFGAQLPLIYAIISEIFGLKHYSTLFNCGQMASPLGSYVLNVKVTGPMYDREAIEQLAAQGLTRSSVRELICVGEKCYRSSFITLAGVTFFGAMASLILVFRTLEFYQGDIYKKYKQQLEEEDKQSAIL